MDHFDLLKEKEKVSFSLSADGEGGVYKALVKKIKEGLIAIVISNKDKSKISPNQGDQVYIYSESDEETWVIPTMLIQNKSYPLIIVSVSGDSTRITEAAAVGGDVDRGDVEPLDNDHMEVESEIEPLNTVPEDEIGEIGEVLIDAADEDSLPAIGSEVEPLNIDDSSSEWGDETPPGEYNLVEADGQDNLEQVVSSAELDAVEELEEESFLAIGDNDEIGEIGEIKDADDDASLEEDAVEIANNDVDLDALGLAEAGGDELQDDAFIMLEEGDKAENDKQLGDVSDLEEDFLEIGDDNQLDVEGSLEDVDEDHDLMAQAEDDELGDVEVEDVVGSLEEDALEIEDEDEQHSADDAIVDLGDDSSIIALAEDDELGDVEVEDVVDSLEEDALEIEDEDEQYSADDAIVDLGDDSSIMGLAADDQLGEVEIKSSFSAQEDDLLQIEDDEELDEAVNSVEDPENDSLVAPGENEALEGAKAVGDLDDQDEEILEIQDEADNDIGDLAADEAMAELENSSLLEIVEDEQLEALEEPESEDAVDEPGNETRADDLLSNGFVMREPVNQDMQETQDITGVYNSIEDRSDENLEEEIIVGEQMELNDDIEDELEGIVNEGVSGGAFALSKEVGEDDLDEDGMAITDVKAYDPDADLLATEPSEGIEDGFVKVSSEPEPEAPDEYTEDMLETEAMAVDESYFTRKIADRGSDTSTRIDENFFGFKYLVIDSATAERLEEVINRQSSASRAAIKDKTQSDIRSEEINVELADAIGALTRRLARLENSIGKLTEPTQTPNEMEIPEELQDINQGGYKEAVCLNIDSYGILAALEEELGDGTCVLLIIDRPWKPRLEFQAVGILFESVEKDDGLHVGKFRYLAIHDEDKTAVEKHVKEGSDYLRRLQKALNS